MPILLYYLFILKRLFLLSIISGVLFSFSWPPYGSPVFIFFALVPLLLLEDEVSSAPLRYSRWFFFLLCFFAFLIWNIVAVHWIYYSTLVGALLTIFFNTLFYTLIFISYYWVKKQIGQSLSYFYLLFIWISFERFHLYWDLSFPWLNLGNVFSSKIAWIQWYEYTGSFGGSLWVLFVNIFLFDIYKNYNMYVLQKTIFRRGILLLVSIFLPITLSYIILKRTLLPAENVEIVVVQPNIDPYSEKYGQTNESFLQHLEELVKNEVSLSTHYIIAPETFFVQGGGVDLSYFSESMFYKKVLDFLKKYPNTYFLSGIMFNSKYYTYQRPTLTANKIQEKVWYDFYNSSFQIKNEDSLQIYHKSKLVPAVEILPFEKVIKTLLGDVLIDFGGINSSLATQKERTVFFNKTLNESTASVICYEAAYGEFVTKFVKNGAAFLSVITNEGWWGKSIGHEQLIQFSQLRAVETRRYIARSANTGISAFINLKGEIYAYLPYGTKGILKDKIALSNKKTFYVKNGDYIAKASVGFSCIFLLLSLINLALKKIKYGT